jgi:hypothetical protein
LETILYRKLKCLNSLIQIRDPGWKKFGYGIRDGKNSDTGSGMETIRIRDPGWKKFGSGSRYKHPGSVTLELILNC